MNMIDEITFSAGTQLRDEKDKFIENIKRPLSDLFNYLSKDIKSDQITTAFQKARTVDENIKRFCEKHPNFEKPKEIAFYLKDRLSELTTDSQVKLPQVVYVSISYPVWVDTDEQRYAWDTIARIAQEYFSERTKLSRKLDWNYGKSHSNYFSRSDVRNILYDAISVREMLLVRLRSVESVEGMNQLSKKVGEMLNNSRISLRYLYNDCDYTSFKRINNRNDKIQIEIRKTFGIR